MKMIKWWMFCDDQDGMDQVWLSKAVEEVLRSTIQQQAITHVRATQYHDMTRSAMCIYD